MLHTLANRFLTHIGGNWQIRVTDVRTLSRVSDCQVIVAGTASGWLVLESREGTTETAALFEWAGTTPFQKEPQTQWRGRLVSSAQVGLPHPGLYFSVFSDFLRHMGTNVVYSQSINAIVCGSTIKSWALSRPGPGIRA